MAGKRGSRVGGSSGATGSTRAKGSTRATPSTSREPAYFRHTRAEADAATRAGRHAESGPVAGRGRAHAEAARLHRSAASMASGAAHHDPSFGPMATHHAALARAHEVHAERYASEARATSAAQPSRTMEPVPHGEQTQAQRVQHLAATLAGRPDLGPTRMPTTSTHHEDGRPRSSGYSADEVRGHDHPSTHMPTSSTHHEDGRPRLSPGETHSSFTAAGHTPGSLADREHQYRTAASSAASATRDAHAHDDVLTHRYAAQEHRTAQAAATAMGTHQTAREHGQQVAHHEDAANRIAHASAARASSEANAMSRRVNNDPHATPEHHREAARLHAHAVAHSAAVGATRPGQDAGHRAAQATHEQMAQTGPRGGTYVTTESGAKRYVGSK